MARPPPSAPSARTIRSSASAPTTARMADQPSPGPRQTQPPARVSLARLPTPLERSPRLGPRLGVSLWWKRDDLTGVELSGNKVRKLEFLLADAEARGADTLITCGGIQSNHCRATALA